MPATVCLLLYFRGRAGWCRSLVAAGNHDKSDILNLIVYSSLLGPEFDPHVLVDGGT